MLENQGVFYPLLAAAIVLAGYILYGKYIAPRLEKPVPQEALHRARAMALEVVCYIEQALPGETGQNKKLAARDKLKQLLSLMNITISEAILDMLIELSVFVMNTEILGNMKKYTK